ncbi:ets DNA-binding protein pokkuri [Onthophagus taurus]|uniref:ets DNA-binding protein pokkuri n=1 Tax=Onthophagus taurus TaxID=166361 RepID=UPI000C206D42|nr:ets DNA-binding protein pokkuri [Onthophagus taurus]XP_022906296.1 ets DNA-binding protein pokkuri [Onthophagus taurus]
MKLVPGPLPPIPTGANAMDRLPLPIPFNTDLFWRYPFPSLPQSQPPSSPLLDYKSQLPNSLPSDPRIWSREDVTSFLRWAEREYDLQPIDMDRFQMNGKAMCLLTRTDLADRAPGSGDVLHNVLQLLMREVNILQRCLPSSPITPTSRHPYPLSPHSQPPTPNWAFITSQNNSENFHPHHIAAHLMVQNNSVTLSPAPSVDSQSGSPQHVESAINNFSHSIFGSSGSNGSGSNQSDSDEDSYNDAKTSPPNTPSAYSLPPPLPAIAPRSPKEAVSSPVFKGMGREFFPSNESHEPNTNGRLLWDFLQQLLNDPAQRYTNYIAWKNRETGIFKIVDPAGLAKLWGIQKNHLSMNYDKMSRALRYYYRVNILKKVQGERHCYQFLRNPTELKNIKNISLLRQQMSPTRTTAPQHLVAQHTIKTEPVEIEHETRRPQEYEEKPTDLSMDMPTDLSSNSSRHVNIVCSPDTPTMRDAGYFKEEDTKVI